MQSLDVRWRKSCKNGVAKTTALTWYSAMNFTWESWLAAWHPINSCQKEDNIDSHQHSGSRDKSMLGKEKKTWINRKQERWNLNTYIYCCVCFSFSLFCFLYQSRILLIFYEFLDKKVVMLSILATCGEARY